MPVSRRLVVAEPYQSMKPYKYIYGIMLKLFRTVALFCAKNLIMSLSPREGIRIVSPNTGASYKLGRRCGSGSFGEVFRAKSIMLPHHVAIKFIRTTSMHEQMNAVIDEINLTKKAASATNGRCPTVHDAFVLADAKSTKSSGSIAIVMDFIDGMSVSDILRKGIIVPEEISIHIGYEILLCLRGLHEASLIHRDIKSSNILISRKGDVFLCDFGVAKAVSEQRAATSTLSGTPFWMAPEMLQGKSYTAKIDIFSLGITMAEMVLGRVPVPKGIREDSLSPGILGELRKNNSVRVDLNPSEFSRPFRQIVSGMVEVCPASRPDVFDAQSMIESTYYRRSGLNNAGTGSISSVSRSSNKRSSFNPKLVLQAIIMSNSSV